MPNEKQITEKHFEEKHVYDDIEELDNSLPRWWINSFYITIVFAVGYFLYYSMFDGPGISKEYESSVKEYELQQLTLKAASPVASEEKLRAFLKDPKRLAAGKEIFMGKCLACHGAAGQGGIGPNLTDDYWIHGGKMTEIVHTVTHGVLDKGMPPWGQMLKQDEIYSVVTFVKSLRGSNPPGAKAPQGELVKE